MRTTKHNLPKRIHISHCIGYREQVQEKEAYRAGILINDKNLHIVLYTGKGNAVTQHGNVRSFLAVNLHKSIRSIYNSDRSKACSFRKKLTTFASPILYSCWNIFPRMIGIVNSTIRRRGLPSVMSMVFPFFI